MLNKFKKYKMFLDEYGINTSETNFYLQKISLHEKMMFFTLTFLVSYIVIEFSLGVVANTSINPFVFGFVIFILFIIFFAFYTKNIEMLDTLVFNKFLSKKLKIFHSIEETKDYEYEEIEYITTKTKIKNVNQILIDLAYKALFKNAEGLILIENKETIITTNRQIGDGANFNEVITQIEKSGMAILIKNIKKKL